MFLDTKIVLNITHYHHSPDTEFEWAAGQCGFFKLQGFFQAGLTVHEIVRGDFSFKRVSSIKSQNSPFNPCGVIVLAGGQRLLKTTTGRNIRLISTALNMYINALKTIKLIKKTAFTVLMETFFFLYKRLNKTKCQHRRVWVSQSD